jgi:hypothetical protein
VGFRGSQRVLLTAIGPASPRELRVHRVMDLLRKVEISPGFSPSPPRGGGPM